MRQKSQGQSGLHIANAVSVLGGAHTHTVWLLELVSAVERKEGKSCVLIGVMAKNL